MPSISDILDSIIEEAIALRQLVDQGDDLEDSRAILVKVDSDLDGVLETDPA